MVRYLFLAFASLLGSIAAHGLSVKSEAGALKSLIENPGEVSELVITGEINAADLDFIDREMTSLTSLDLEAAKITRYEGASLRGMSTFDAGTIPANMFVGSCIGTIVLPAEGALTIGDAAFAGSAIESLTLGANVQKMGIGCFSTCPNLKTVTINGSTLGESSFSGCPRLVEVMLADVKAIPACSFKGCTSLSVVDFGESIDEIGDEAFMGSALNMVDLSLCKSLVKVGDWAFASMPMLEALNLGNATVVGKGVVFECKELKDFIFSAAATELGDYAYTNNTQMNAEGLFNDNVVSIGSYALSGLTQIQELTLPQALAYIGDNAMERMSGLQRISIEAAAVPELGENVWAEVDQYGVKLKVDDDKADAYRAVEQWREFDITGMTSNNAAISPAEIGIVGRFEGDKLLVKVSGVTVNEIALYNTAGVLLASVVPQSDLTIIDTAAFSENIYIVRATMAGDGIATLKIARNGEK